MFGSIRLIIIVASALSLPACTLFDVDKVLDRAIDLVKQSGKKNYGKCMVDGHNFAGLRGDEFSQPRNGKTGDSPHNLKLLVVHGIGHHSPGYSNRLVLNLIHELGMKKKGNQIVNIRLALKIDENKISGNALPDYRRPHLRISNFTKADKPNTLPTNKTKTNNTQKENKKHETGPDSLTVFEVTWSPIIEEERKALLYENQVKFGLERAFLNATIKRFLNDRAVDPLIYARKDNSNLLGSTTAVRLTERCWL